MILSKRELDLIDGMIEVQLNHAERCDRIANRRMAEKQKGWDMERVELLRKLKQYHSSRDATVTDHQSIDLDEGHGRVETGILSFTYTNPDSPEGFDKDWPGIFIRGDNAFHYALNLGHVLNKAPTADPMAVMVTTGLFELLQSCDVRRMKAKQEATDE